MSQNHDGMGDSIETFMKAVGVSTSLTRFLLTIVPHPYPEHINSDWCF